MKTRRLCIATHNSLCASFIRVIENFITRGSTPIRLDSSITSSNLQTFSSRIPPRTDRSRVQSSRTARSDSLEFSNRLPRERRRGLHSTSSPRRAGLTRSCLPRTLGHRQLSIVLERGIRPRTLHSVLRLSKGGSSSQFLRPQFPRLNCSARPCSTKHSLGVIWDHWTVISFTSAGRTEPDGEGWGGGCKKQDITPT